MRDLSPPTARRLLVALWAINSAVMIVLFWSLIVPLDFRDPDDALRLVQVRDLLGGQSWFDLAQHRIAQPDGVLMHWSRLVDLPVATLIGFFGLFTSQPVAERITLVLIPLLLLLALYSVLYRLRGPLGTSRKAALTSCVLLATTLSALVQFTPLRIDHHSWQILLGTLATYGLLLAAHGAAHEGRRGSLIAGLAMAGWMQISIEGLPYAAGFGAILALLCIFTPRGLRDLAVYLLVLTGASALLMPIGHGGLAAFAMACDAMSPGYLVPLAVSTATLVIAMALLRPASLLLKAATAGIAGVAGAASFLALSRACLAGPFDSLEPIVYRLWYLSVMEGRPLAEQPADMQAIIVVPALIGLAGAVMAWRAASSPEVRRAWLTLIAVQIIAALISLDVMRAMGFAHVVALPGIVSLLFYLFGQAQKIRLMPLRVIATALTMVSTPLGSVAVIAALIDTSKSGKEAQEEEESAETSAARLHCATSESLHYLDGIAPARIFAPLDIGSHILVYSHHNVVATGHHRNIAGMKAVIEGFIEPPAKAEPIIRASGAQYLAYCPLQMEIERYAGLAPKGLIGVLEADSPPAWLERVPLPPLSDVRLYRIVGSPAAPAR